MNLLNRMPAVASALLLSACVTINIYFPAAAAEKAANEIVEDIIQQSGEIPPPESKGDQSGALNNSFVSEKPAVAILIETALDFFISPASAAADFSINTPTISRLRASMKQRHGTLLPYYTNGAVGFTKDGLVALRDASAVSLKDRNSVTQLVTAENTDRNALYAAIAQANGHPEWEGEVRATFARSWMDNAAAGWWIQDPKGSWTRK